MRKTSTFTCRRRTLKQSWGEKFVIGEEFLRPWNRKITTNWENWLPKNLFRDHSSGAIAQCSVAYTISEKAIRFRHPDYNPDRAQKLISLSMSQLGGLRIAMRRAATASRGF